MRCVPSPKTGSEGSGRVLRGMMQSQCWKTPIAWVLRSWVHHDAESGRMARWKHVYERNEHVSSFRSMAELNSLNPARCAGWLALINPPHYRQ